MGLKPLFWRLVLTAATILQSQAGSVRLGRDVRVRTSDSTTRCVSELPQGLLYSQNVLTKDSVKTALAQAKSFLESTFSDRNPDTISVAIVHASQAQPILTFNHGALHLNGTASGLTRQHVTSDSIFRVNSISKAMVALTAVILQNITAGQAIDKRITWSTRVADMLPDFSLPQADWNNGGSEITIGMLATELSGLRREGYANGFDLRRNDTRATTAKLGGHWSAVMPQDVLEFTRTKGLLWAPGERPSYSNAGFSILGYALANYLRTSTNFTGEWADVATKHIIEPLNMTHSFFGLIPDDLKRFVSVPGVSNWIDLVIHAGYDPAAGMFSSANDLAKVVHHVYLKQSPDLISLAQRRNWMRPGSLLNDGQQAVGPGWEIQHVHTPHDFATYEVYGKEGDGGGQHSYIDALPALGYGVVVLLSESNGDGVNYTTPYPVELGLKLHDMLAPAFRTAYTTMLTNMYAGTYKAADGHNGEAMLVMQDESLHLARMAFDGVDVLQRIDQLSWTEGNQPVLFSKAGGPSLHPSTIQNTWHMAIDSETCDWFDFDGYTDANGDPVDGLTIEPTEDGLKLTYPPIDAVFYRTN